MIGTRTSGMIRDLDPAVGPVAVKRSKAAVRADEEWPYTLLDLALFPTWLTIAAAVISFLVASIRGGPEAFSLAAGFAAGSAVLFYSVTFLVGGLGLVPTVLSRLRRRITRQWGRRIEPGKALWDDWVDGL